MSQRLIIEYILKTHKITDYLAMLGIDPVHHHGDKISYLCPVHKDSNPSFYVYTPTGEYQNFYCFGCKIHGNIIHLKQKIEKKNFGETLEGLSGGVDIGNISAAEVIANGLFSVPDESGSVGKIVWQFSRMVRKYLNDVNRDPAEVAFVDQAMQKVDKRIHEMNVSELKAAKKKMADLLSNRKLKILQSTKKDQ